MTEFGVETIELDLPPLVGAFSRRLHDAGVPVTAERAAQLARALTLTEPVSRRRLYFAARAAVLTDRGQRPAFDRVFAEVFGVGADIVHADALPEDSRRVVAPDQCSGDAAPAPLRVDAAVSPAPSGRRSAVRRARRTGATSRERELPVPMVATDEEVLRAKRFDELAPDELAALYELMARLTVATPRRLSRRRRASPPRRAGRRADDAAPEPADRRRSDPAGARAGVASSAAGSCCCATSRARWSPTRAPTCSS